MSNLKSFWGLIPAAFTPFTSSGELATDRISDLYELYRESTIDCTFINGSTGEFTALSTDERMALTDAWVNAVPSSFGIWVHVGHNNQREAIRLAQHAASSGAKAISALAPTYFKPASVPDLIDYLAPIAAAAPDLPFYYYEIPSMTGVTFPPESVLTVARERIPTFAGIKFSSHNLFQLQNCIALAPDLDFLFGSDEMLLGAIALGANGAIGSTYNIAAPLYHQMLRAHKNGLTEDARRLQNASAQFVQILVEFGVLAAQKAILKMMGIDAGPLRPPLCSLDLDAERRLYDRVADLDIFPRKLQRF